LNREEEEEEREKENKRREEKKRRGYTFCVILVEREKKRNCPFVPL
jgi:hypothetical protein